MAAPLDARPVLPKSAIRQEAQKSASAATMPVRLVPVRFSFEKGQISDRFVMFEQISLE